jgi:hypothetical protein
MAKESAQMYLERYLLPTSLTAMLWTRFNREDSEIQLDTQTGYRVVRKQMVLVDPLGTLSVYGYDLVVDISVPPSVPDRSPASYTLRFTYPSSPDEASSAEEIPEVIPQPLQQALLKGIREDGRSSGWVRVQSLDYRGSGRFQATVLIAD